MKCFTQQLLLLLVFLLGGLGILAQRALGWRPAIFYLLTLLTTQGVVRTFELGEADHHGIVLAFASACALCLVAGGAGFARRKDENASHWFMASGVAGAAALWVSASTALKTLAWALSFSASSSGSSVASIISSRLKYCP